MRLFRSATPIAREPLDAPWPEDGLETLGACPVCGSRERALAYQGLRDAQFFSAPGAWTAWTCKECNILYIDPRPTEASIHLAYAAYYTHARPSLSMLGVLRKLQLGIRRSHLNRNLGYHLSGALPFGWMAYKLMPHQAAATNHTIRHLQPPLCKERLLDIGCGHGEFLEVARDIGFDASGLDFDPVARAEAQKGGFVVHPGPFPGTTLEPNSYDHITMSHVLEHFHDPVAALREALMLLKPGGRIWIKVPNKAALFYIRFSNSYIMDPPRHLVMFDWDSLTEILRKITFENIVRLPPNFREHWVSFSGGWAVSQGYDPVALMLHSTVPASIKAEIISTYERVSKEMHHAETVTMTATKPA